MTYTFKEIQAMTPKATPLTREEMIAVIEDELTDQKSRYERGKANHYEYLWMLANDLGLINIE